MSITTRTCPTHKVDHPAGKWCPKCLEISNRTDPTPPQAVKVAESAATQPTPEGLKGMWIYLLLRDGNPVRAFRTYEQAQHELAIARMTSSAYSSMACEVADNPDRFAAPPQAAGEGQPSAAGAASAPEGKDCPHCGHEPSIENLRSSTPVYPIAMRISCSDCGASAAVAMGTDHDAVLLKAWSMWDRRFTEDEVQR